MPTANSNSSVAPPSPSNAEVAGIYLGVVQSVAAVLNILGVREAPPARVTRPAYPADLRKMQLADVLAVRDAMLIYRSILVDELCRCRGLELPSKEQVDMLKGRLMKNSVETNADRRKAAVEADNNYIKTNSIYVQYKAVRVALESQLEQIDAELERLRDECFYKQRQLPSVTPTPRALPPQTPRPITAVTQQATEQLPPAVTTPPVRPVPLLRPKR